MTEDDIDLEVHKLLAIIEDRSQPNEARSIALRDLTRLCEMHGHPMPCLSVPT